MHSRLPVLQPSTCSRMLHFLGEVAESYLTDKTLHLASLRYLD